LSFKAVVMDYIGTLTTVKAYNLAMSRAKLYGALVESGFGIEEKEFHEAYVKAHEKYRVIRYEKYVEVTNAIWVSEALNSLGFKIDAGDSRLKVALNVFFKDYVDSLELRPHVLELLQDISCRCKLGLISNFTFAPVVHSSLQNLGIHQFFNAILVSDEVGWRKPHKLIFEGMLSLLHVGASETVFVGDSPLEDIKGAQSVGMRTIFISSQFNKVEDLQENKINPDATAKDLLDVRKYLKEAFWLKPFN
jgi:putative hydrolase of the HAD superfamily